MTTKIPVELSSTPSIVDNGDATAITIDSSERVGIGTTSPQRPFHLHSGSGDISLAMTNSTTGSTSTDGFNIFVTDTNPDVIFKNRENTAMTFHTNNTERMRIDSSGNVGIGTTSPHTTLVVNGGTFADIALQSSNSGTGSGQGGLISIDTNNNLYFWNFENLPLLFGTNNTERMRLDNDGHLLLGVDTPVANSRLRVKSSGSSGSEYTCEMGSADGTTQFLLRSDGAFFTGTDSNSPFNSAGAAANVQVLSNGALTRVSSSRRYKQDITDATWGLDEVKQLRPVTFRSNRTDELSDPNVHGGFIAEEVHDIGGLTSFIGYDENNEAETLHYGNMVSLLTKAIQEQQTIIEDLQTQINEVKNGN